MRTVSDKHMFHISMPMEDLDVSTQCMVVRYLYVVYVWYGIGFVPSAIFIAKTLKKKKICSIEKLPNSYTFYLI